MDGGIESLGREQGKTRSVIRTVVSLLLLFSCWYFAGCWDGWRRELRDRRRGEVGFEMVEGEVWTGGHLWMMALLLLGVSRV